MHSRVLLLGLVLLGAVLPRWAIAQEYPGGLYIPPLPVVPSVYPNGTIQSAPPAPSVNTIVTGSTGSRMMTAFPDDVGAPVARPAGCAVRTYDFGPGRNVRVHRC
jgi:hypothetical protein